MNWPQKMANIENGDVEHKITILENKLNGRNGEKSSTTGKKELPLRHWRSPQRFHTQNKIDGMHFEEDEAGVSEREREREQLRER